MTVASPLDVRLEKDGRTRRYVIRIAPKGGQPDHGRILLVIGAAVIAVGWHRKPTRW